MINRTQQKYNILHYFLYYIIFYINKLLYKLGLLPPKPVTPLTEIEIFIAKHSKKFLNSYIDENSVESMNTNIDPLFYSRKEFKKLLNGGENFLEKQWKTRILLENTPRGNIIMYYDTFREGFAYYSDQSMTYPILNAIAMKYVITYRCRNFFIDDNITPKETSSPFIKFIQDEEKEENDKKKTVIKNMVNNTNNDNLPFAKLKKYSLQNEKPNAIKTNKKEEKKDDRIYYKNKIVYLGKMINYSIIQQNTKKIIYPESYSIDADDPKKAMNYFTYKDFKKSHFISSS